MTALAWLAIPLAALLCAVVAVTWMGRPRRKAQMRHSVRSYERFRAALAAPPTPVNRPVMQAAVDADQPS